MNVLISILIASYNSEKFIEQTILSCLNQSEENYEIVISDDNSDDNTWNIVQKFNNIKIIKYKQKKNLGEYANRNFLIEKATGKYVIFIDGEDLLYSNAIATLQQYIVNYPNASQFIAHGWNENIIFPRPITPNQFIGLELFGPGCVGLNFTRLIFKKSSLIEVNNFDNFDVKIGDVYIQYKLGFRYNSVLISEGFSWWRRRKGQASEKILSENITYFLEELKFKECFIAESKSKVTTEEYKIILYNFYGNILRNVLRSLVKFDKNAFLFLKSNYHLFARYWKSIFFKPKRYFLDNHSGENPF